MDIGNLVSLIVSVSALVTVIIAWRKLPRENQNMDGSAAAKYADLVDRAAKRESDYMDKIDKLEKRIEHLEACQSELEEKVKLTEKNAAKFENWAKRLAHQVESLNGTPVPLEIEKK